MNLKDNQLKLFEIKIDNKLITDMRVLAKSSDEAIEMVKEIYANEILYLNIINQPVFAISVNEIIDPKFCLEDKNILKNDKINFILDGESSTHVSEMKDNIFYGLDIKSDFYADYYLFKKQNNIIWSTHLWCYKKQFNEKNNMITATYIDRQEPIQFEVIKIKPSISNISLEKLYINNLKKYDRYMDLSAKVKPKNYMVIKKSLPIKDANVHKILVDNKEFLKSNFLKSKERV